MKKILVFITAIVFVLAGCTPAVNGGINPPNNENGADGQTEKITVVATLFPQYDIVKQIGGDFVEVSMLIPPGVEAHGYEPTPKDIINLQKADLVIYTTEFMENWVTKIPDIKSFDLSKGTEGNEIVLLKEDDDHEHESHEEHAHEDHDHEHESHEEHAHEDHDHHHHDHGGVDPHYWLGFENIYKMIDSITVKLTEIAKEKGMNVDFAQRASKLKEDFAQIEQTAKAATFKNKHIVSGGHFAFGYLAHELGLTFSSPYIGFAPDSEPTPQNIAKLVKFISENEVSAIYFEELVSNKVASTISDETGCKLLMLHGAHNLSKDEVKQGLTFVEIMKRNIETLKEGQN